MVIGIDGNEANIDKKVGISEYVYELLMQFHSSQQSEISNQKEHTKFKIYLKEKPTHGLPMEAEGWEYKVFGPKKMWTQFALPAKLYLEREKPDVFFSPAHYAPRFSPVPTVISIMDLAFFHFPELFAKKDLYQLHKWTEYSVKKASKIITISEASKDDIIKLYHIPQDRIHVVYPGIKESLTLTPHNYSMQDLQQKYGISDNFILFVGTLQPRKNIVRAIEAFSKVVSRRSEIRDQKSEDGELQFVIVGRKGWLYEDILAAPKKYGVEDKVKFLDFVPDDELPTLYKNAKCFLWPSLYEGFGLPVVEAMSYGCPVITSNTSSLPEAGGDAAVYVDPRDTDDIAKKLQVVLSTKSKRAEMIEKGKKQVAKFSWEKAAEQTLEVLQQVAKGT